MGVRKILLMMLVMGAAEAFAKQVWSSCKGKPQRKFKPFWIPQEEHSIFNSWLGEACSAEKLDAKDDLIPGQFRFLDRRKTLQFEDLLQSG